MRPRPQHLTIIAIALLATGLTAQVRVVPIAEGWAKNQVNAVIFRKNSVTSHRDHQYAAFYDADSNVIVAKRRLGSTDWAITKTGFTGNTADAHNSISIAVDGRGFLYLAWGNHNKKLNYARSAKVESADAFVRASMIVRKEDRVSYPEFYSMPDGDLLFFYRDGTSGNGDLVLNRWDAKKQVWSRVQDKLIDGERQRNAYPQITVDLKGSIHLSWVWRETPDVATNHDLCYARSDDTGKTWVKSSSEKYQLPITASMAEYIYRIPQKSELINQTSMTTDERGRPYIATYWRDADSQVPQYRVAYSDGKNWRMSQVGSRKTAFSLSGGGTKRIPISRPQIVANRGRVNVIFRDEERGSKVSVASTNDIDAGIWKIADITGTSVGMWEPSYDNELWRRRGLFELFVQRVGQGDGEKLEDIGPQMISILEWRPK
ncbi:MAG: BNR repeat-containing protein [Pyrinomonadaceae bacterium]